MTPSCISGVWRVVNLLLVENVLSKCFTLSADHPDHLILFRKYVSRKAAGKGRAVLEGVGLDSETIEACFRSHPETEEEAVQAGLVKWCGGQGKKPPTWQMLFAAMEYAQIAQQHVHELMKETGLFGMQYVTGVCVRACVRVCVCACVHPFMHAACVHAYSTSVDIMHMQWISKCMECIVMDSAGNKYQNEQIWLPV